MHLQCIETSLDHHESSTTNQSYDFFDQFPVALASLPVRGDRNVFDSGLLIAIIWIIVVANLPIVSAEEAIIVF